MKFLAGIKPPYIYHSCLNRKELLEEKFSTVHMTSCGILNVKKRREIKNGDKYIALDISLELDCLDKR